MKDDIGSEVKKAAFWTYGSAFFLNLLQFIVGIVLARILGPTDFGVFIAATAFTAVFSHIARFGIPQALVYGKDVTDGQYNAAFWAMFLIAILCAIILWACADWLQQYYQDDRFLAILLLMTATLFLIPYVAVNNSILRRDMDFKTANLVGIKTTMIYVIPITVGFALSGFGPFSLVAGGITAQLATTFMYWRKTKWLPGAIELKPIRPLIPYAAKSNIANLQNVLSERVDNMLVGALIGVMPLGIYNRAYSLAKMPVEQLALQLQPVLFSGLARIQGDLIRTRQIYQKSLCALSMAVFPFLALFWLIAPDFIGLLYGEAWLPAVTPLRIMSLGAAASLITMSFRSISAAQNLVGKEAWVQLAGLILLVTLIITLSRWGVVGVAAGVTIKEILVFLIFQRVIARSHLAFSWKSLIRVLAPAVIATLICSTVTRIMYLYLPEILGLRLFVISIALLSIYAVTLKIMADFWVSHAELQSSISVVRDIARRIPGFQRLIKAAS